MKRGKLLIGVSVLALACSLVPPSDVANVWIFEAKLIGGTLLLVILARWIFVRAERVRTSEFAQ